MQRSLTGQEKMDKLYKILECCRLCPRKCGVNRIKGELGFCRSEDKLIISSFGPHFGEEPPLVERGGSGTIFLTNCNLGCIYCQNYDISHEGKGYIVSEEEMAGIMLTLQGMGCENINFVTPTHFAPQIARSIKIARDKGLFLPIVYNCGGYEELETIRYLEGFVDIYMPDFKYGDRIPAQTYSFAPDYFEKCCLAIKEMHDQVGDLRIEKGIAKRGLLVRHLVLPNNMAGTEKVLRFIANEISTETYLNIMVQYRALYKAHLYREINRRPSKEEFEKAVSLAKDFGLYRGFPASFPFSE